MVRFGSGWLVAMSCVWPLMASAASTTGVLPAWVCAHPDAIHVHGFETQAARYSEPSGGSGGEFPGALSRTVSAIGVGLKPYHLYVPTSYSPSRPMPLVLALHGTGGPNTAPLGATTARDNWAIKAESGQFIVIAAIASGSQGGWAVPPNSFNDYSVFRAMLDDVKAAYNIDVTRIYGWGYSSGGHVMHDMMYGQYGSGLNIDVFAGYGVSAGVLAGLLCGNPPGAACSNLLASQTRRIPLDIHIGTSDPLLSFAQDDYNRFIAAGWTANSTIWTRVFVGGHNYTATHLSEIWDHLCPFQRLP